MVAIQEIEASYGEKPARIVRGWYETQDGTQKAERARANAEDYRKEHRDSSHVLISYHLMTPGGCIPIG
jgi:hypothetical protein